jgi:iron complex transport system ATP-binding protein
MTWGDATHVLECDAISVRVPGRELVLDLGVRFQPGSMVAVLGRNGAGKSSLLHVLAGLALPSAGRVRLGATPLAAWPRRELARRIGLLTQASEDPFPGTALETALVGRHPHLGFWQWEGDADRAVARDCLAAMDLAGLEQDPGVFLLDEPIQQLDPHHQLGVLRRFRALADAGRTVVLTLHDPGLAARFADAALLLFGDGRWQHGPATDSLSATAITELYGTPVQEIAWSGGRTFVPS